MPWSTLPKDLSVSTVHPHVNSQPGVAGRAPGVTKIQFTPLEFFGAAARCSHMHAVNPNLATPESAIVAALVEQYVDDVSADFAILAQADSFKDYIKSYFAGTVAAGLAYLLMVRDGYIWTDHFEKIVGGHPSHRRTPDFIFAGSGSGVAITEAKGSRALARSAFDQRVEAGYLGQVEPHLGYSLGGVTATHGYCIGAWLTSTSKAELLVHHTALPAIGPDRDEVAGPSALIVQQHNYATALLLANAPEVMVDQLRAGRLAAIPMFLRLHRQDRNWLVGLGGRRRWPGFALERFERELKTPPPKFMAPWFGFAIDEEVLTAVLRRFTNPDRRDDVAIDIPALYEVAEMARTGEDGGIWAVMPDGLAVFGDGALLRQPEIVHWEGDRFAGG